MNISCSLSHLIRDPQSEDDLRRQWTEPSAPANQQGNLWCPLYITCKRSFICHKLNKYDANLIPCCSVVPAVRDHSRSVSRARSTDSRGLSNAKALATAHKIQSKAQSKYRTTGHTGMIMAMPLPLFSCPLSRKRSLRDGQAPQASQFRQAQARQDPAPISMPCHTIHTTLSLICMAVLYLVLSEYIL